jgi:uncharacterized iron-regulated membrane protein
MATKTNWKMLTRKLHYWAAIIIAAPAAVIIGSGVFLQLKKHVGWIQPPTQRGSTAEPTLQFPAILDAARAVPEAEVDGWEQIDRLDVQPQQGIIKIHAVNQVEVQIDHSTGEVLQVARRRSDLIEDIHDGSFFHDAAKLWVFLPAGAGLLLLWGTGLYLFFLPFIARRKKRESFRS